MRPHLLCVVFALAAAGCPPKEPIEPGPPAAPGPEPEAPVDPDAPGEPAEPPAPDGDPEEPDDDAAPRLPGNPGAATGGPMQQILAVHNRFRADHCAPPLAWSEELAGVAQAWADRLRDDGCAFGHSKTRYGENLAAGSSREMSPGSVATMWYREVEDYDFGNQGFSMRTGHFTQLVWKGTTRLGCGVATCKGMDIWVCNYDPAGNVHGFFERNVLPARCAKK